MISATSLSKSFGERVLFEGASFRLNPGERYGLVGANGSGKTTLLNILAGDMEAGGGSVDMPRRIRLGVLRQDRFLYEDEQILQVTLMGNEELWCAMAERDEVLARAGEHFDADRFSRVEEVFERHDGYTAEPRAAAILEGLGLPARVHHDPLSTLSGGFRLRVLLAQVLASAPDALLLDEPTNHLDIVSIRWLEKFLRGFRGPVVVISHDHRFLDNVATHILDIDYETVIGYPGNYTRFLGAKAAERERREKEIAVREREIAHHRKFVDRFRAKASKARQAQSKLRLIEKRTEALVELPKSSRRYPTFRFEQRRPSGREVLRVKGVGKSFGDNRVLRDVNLRVGRGRPPRDRGGPTGSASPRCSRSSWDGWRPTRARSRGGTRPGPGTSRRTRRTTWPQDPEHPSAAPPRPGSATTAKARARDSRAARWAWCSSPATMPTSVSARSRAASRRGWCCAA